MMPDIKHFYNDLGGFALSDTGFIIGALQNSGASTFQVQGDAEENRHGDTVRIKTISVNYKCYIPTGMTSDATNVLRVMVVRDKSVAGAFPGIFTDILDTGALAPGDDVIAHKNFVNETRFKILYDRLHNMTQGGVQTVSGKIRIKGSGSSTFNANSGAVTDVQNNHYWLVAFTDSTATAHPVWAHQIQTKYYDN